MTRLYAAVAVAAIGLGVGGCALTFDSTRLGVPVAMADTAARPAGTPFHITRHPVFLLWGAYTASPPSLEDVLAGQVGTGTAVSQVRIHVRARWSDLLVTALTAGLCSPRTVTFEGLVVGPQP